MNCSPEERGRNNFPILQIGQDAVVPSGQDGVSDQVHGVFGGLAHFSTDLVNLVEDIHHHRKSRPCLGLPHQFGHQADVVEDHAPADPSEVREQAMFDRVVLRRIRRVVRHADLHPQSIGQALNVGLEQVGLAAFGIGRVTAATVAEKEQLFGVGIGLSTGSMFGVKSPSMCPDSSTNCNTSFIS